MARQTLNRLAEKGKCIGHYHRENRKRPRLRSGNGQVAQLARRVDKQVLSRVAAAPRLAIRCRLKILPTADNLQLLSCDPWRGRDTRYHDQVGRRAGNDAQYVTDSR